MRTVNLQLSKELKANGYPQDCCEGGYYSNYGINEIGESDDYYHSGRVSKNDLWEREDNEIEHLDYHHAFFLQRAKKQHEELDIQLIASPTADEILDRLPAEDNLVIKCWGWTDEHGDRTYVCQTESQDQDNYTPEVFEENSLADACARMYIYLKKEGLLGEEGK